MCCAPRLILSELTLTPNEFGSFVIAWRLLVWPPPKLAFEEHYDERSVWTVACQAPLTARSAFRTTSRFRPRLRLDRISQPHVSSLLGLRAESFEVVARASGIAENNCCSLARDNAT